MKVGAASPEVVPALIGCLKDRDSNVRSHAADALGKLKAKQALPALQQLWKTDKDTFVHSSAGSALEALGEKVTW